MPSLIGNKPNQVPSNGDLGTLAFQDSNAVNLTGGTAVIDNLTADAINLKVDTDISNIAPSLNLDFANSKTLDPRITYTRASTATFYDGVTTAKAEENLLQQSQTFETTWTANNVTITANDTAAPDGTTTADKLLETTTTGTHRVYENITTSATSFTASFYAKPIGRDFVYIRIRDSVASERHAYFDITTGAVGTVEAGITASIVDAGNGWYRCIATIATAAAGSQSVVFGIASADNTNSYAGDITKGAHFWGAQLEQRSAVSSYTPTTTQAITNYIPALQTAASGVARFEHNPTTGESLGLLIEEARTNIALQSEDFTTTWTLLTTTVSSNQAVSPNGTLTADKIIVDSGSGMGSGVTQSITAAAATYTYSCYAKSGEYNRVRLLIRGNASAGNSASVIFSLVDGSITTAAAVVGTFTSPSATSTNVGNGWYRLTLTLTSTGETAVRARVLVDDSVATTGDGYSGIYIWGAQLEAGAFATSYIPTVASQVTRAADIASMAGSNLSSWYRADEGTIYSEYSLPTTLSSGRVYEANNGTDSNRIFLSTGTTASVTVSYAAAAQVSFNPSALLSNKTAFAYKTDDFAFSLNGESALNDTSGIVPVITTFIIGNNRTSSYNGQLKIGYIKKLAYYPVRLPDDELREMTA